MYEKYSGLPDTTKSAQQNGSRPTSRSDSRSANIVNHQISSDQTPNRNASRPTAKRVSARKAKARKRRIILGGMSLVFLALIVTAILLIVKSCSKPSNVSLESGTFHSGVSINGMDVSGKTVDDVRPQLESNESIFLERIAITLSSAELTATVTGADMDATTNLDEVIEQALSGGANQNFSTTVSIDEAALANRIDSINQTSSKPPVDAGVTMNFSSSGKPDPQYIEGTTGYGLDVTTTTEMIKQAIASGQWQTTLTPTLTTIEPSITLAEVQSNFSPIAKFSTTYSFKGTAEDTAEQRELIPNRAFNVEKSADKINGQVIKPGQTWSYNTVVGDRTEANGWKEANGIWGGDTLKREFGGGVCQTSTTLYNALLQAFPYIEIVDRHHHSFPSTYVDMGLDATVDTDHIDFKFKNISEHPLYIYAYCTENKMYKSRKRDLNVVIYGQALPEGEEYKTRVVVVSEESPGPDEITESKKLFIGEENILATARNKYVIDVFIDHYVNGEVVEEIYRQPGPDIYPGNPLRKQVGIMPTPTPVPSPTPTPTPVA